MRIRPATLDDIEAIARVRVETWRVCFAGILPQDLLEGLSVERTAAAWRSNWLAEAEPPIAFVAENDSGEVTGFVIAGRSREEEGAELGEVYVLYILPECQRHGLGRNLLNACWPVFRQRGIKKAILWCLEKNPACEFYRHLGGKPVDKKTALYGGEKFIEIGFVWNLEEITSL